MKSIDNLFAKIGSYPWRGDSDMADFDALVEAVQDEIREGYIELPMDADGEVIHIGDKMEGVDKYDSLKNVTGEVTAISFKSDGIVDVAIQAWNRVGNSWHIAHLDPNASVYRHYHKPPTVEDMLREFAEKVIDSQIPSVHPTYEEAITEYAAKLRLANSEE